jgi:oxygen-independent coproporphyrinogen-3 oxidase
VTAPADAAQRYLRPGTLSLRELPPLSLYVHLPWCLKKCPYCDFNSHEAGRTLAPELEARYLQALCADLEASLPLVWGRRVVSVFIGGGTPSLFSPEAVAQLIADVRTRAPSRPSASVPFAPRG